MKIVLYVLDGLQVGALDLVETPEARVLRNRSLVVKPTNTIYPSLTGPGHASILTGLLPGSHGLISHMYWDWNGGLKNIYSDDAFEKPTFLELLSKRGIKSEGHGNYFRRGIADTPKKKFLKWVANRAEKVSTITNALEAMPSVEKFLKRNVAGTLDGIDTKISESDSPVHYVLDNTTDKASHKYGPLSTEYTTSIERALSKLLTVVNALESKGEEFTVFVTSDHGHTSVDNKVTAESLDLGAIGLPPRETRVVNANLIVEYGRSGTEAVAVVVSRHIQVYLKDKSKTGAVTRALYEKGIFERLLNAEEIHGYGVSNPRTGDIIGSLKDEIGFAELPIGVRGDHGGFTDKEMNVPLWVIGSGIRKGETKGSGTVDIAPTIFTLLGQNGASFDGATIRIRD